MSIRGRLLDERFFAHRQRSTSVAGIASTLAAWGMATYHFYAGDGIRWELAAVVATFIVVKLALMAWYYLTD